MVAAASGNFGPMVLDYCELVTFRFGDKRVMLLYRDVNSDYLWLFNPGEAGGSYRDLGAARLAGRITARVTWSGANLSASVSREGLELAPPLERPLGPGETDLPASVRVGVGCYGVTPDVRLAADDVEIYAPP